MYSVLCYIFPGNQRTMRLINVGFYNLKESSGRQEHWPEGKQELASIQFSLVAQSCPTLCDPMDSSTPGFPVHHQLPEPTQTQTALVMPTNHLILCHPLFLLPSLFPSIRVFSNELALHIRCLKFWSFSFNISPFNEYSGLISFRIDWVDLLAVQGIVKSLFQLR